MMRKVILLVVTLLCIFLFGEAYKRSDGIIPRGNPLGETALRRREMSARFKVGEKIPKVNALLHSIRGGADFPEPHDNDFGTKHEAISSLQQQHQQPSKPSLMRKIFSLFTSTESFFMGIVSSFTSDLDIAILIAKFCSYSFWAYTSLSILGTIGIDTKPFLTVLNIAFITLGFAAKDIITSFFAGIFILLIRPFQRGSVVCMQGYRGQVVSVDLRYVKLLDQTNGNIVLIPLSMVYGSPIVIEPVGHHDMS